MNDAFDAQRRTLGPEVRRADLSELTGPALRVVRGEPTVEELAALATVVASSGTQPAPAAAISRGGWNDPAAQHRRYLPAGPGGWRAAAR